MSSHGLHWIGLHPHVLIDNEVGTVTFIYCSTIVDEDGELLELNDAALASLGTKMTEVVSAKKFSEVSTAKQRGFIPDAWRRELNSCAVEFVSTSTKEALIADAEAPEEMPVAQHTLLEDHEIVTSVAPLGRILQDPPFDKLLDDLPRQYQHGLQVKDCSLKPPVRDDSSSRTLFTLDVSSITKRSNEQGEVRGLLTYAAAGTLIHEVLREIDKEILGLPRPSSSASSGRRSTLRSATVSTHQGATEKTPVEKAQVFAELTMAYRVPMDQVKSLTDDQFSQLFADTESRISETLTRKDGTLLELQLICKPSLAI